MGRTPVTPFLRAGGITAATMAPGSLLGRLGRRCEVGLVGGIAFSHRRLGLRCRGLISGRCGGLIRLVAGIGGTRRERRILVHVEAAVEGLVLGALNEVR